jgi:predicted adenine nucleotide alpha hydrolase (AANH) superfamily ATPase
VVRARNKFLHKSFKGVEISKWQRKRCTRQFALNVERNVKSPSNPTQADLFTAVSAGPRRELQEEDSRPV